MFYIKIYRKNHYFHLVEPSIIPVVLSLVLLSFTINLVFFLHDTFYFNSFINQLNLILFIIVMNWWFFSMRKESNQLFIYTKFVENNILTGMLLFILSEIFLFVSVFWAFFHSSLCPSIFIGATWPPKGIDSINAWGVPLLNTIILLVSGVTVNSYYYSLKSLSFCFFSTFPRLSNFNKQSFYKFCLLKPFLEIKNFWILLYRYLLITIFLGVFFLGVQLYEYINSSFAISDSVYGSIFYMSTGLHGCHVLLGLIMLISCLSRTIEGDFDLNPKIHISATCTVWYWHFVDVVWLFLFIFVYIWGSKY